MKTKIEDGGPAFPHRNMVIKGTGRTFDKEFEGMSLLDYFAGLAMQGFCTGGPWIEADEKHIAEKAYDQAYAMIMERKKDLEPRGKNENQT